MPLICRPMKPETIARRAAKAAADKAERYATMTARLLSLIERDGPDSIWPDMLREHLERSPT